MQNYHNWNTQKIKLNNLPKFQHPRVGEIWWCRIGLNIGTEVYGKGTEYTRPVLIINNEGSENCVCVPLSSKLKNSKYSVVIKSQDNNLHTAMIYQIRSIDKRRLKNKLSSISKKEHLKVVGALETLYKI